MIKNKLDLIGEQTSPLFRIMSIHNFDQPARRNFDNNICAFHIGNGIILSVAHNIKAERKIVQSIEEAVFQAEILPQLNAEQLAKFNQIYPLPIGTNTRYPNFVTQDDVTSIMEIIGSINFDTRFLNLTNRNFCRQYLIIQFTNNEFYNDPILTATFNANTYFHEPALNRHTFLIELELIDAYYSEDIAAYRIVNTEQNVIDRLPSLTADFSILEDNQENIFCLQSSPNGSLGRLVNKASIEGYLDHHAHFSDRFEGNYIFEGMRYLIKGYFRFGSSGAPYVFYDNKTEEYKVNAVQSEACPIQLSINNNQEGNFQYVNAIASPLNIIQDRLEALI
jgi:hypothetical protein